MILPVSILIPYCNINGEVSISMQIRNSLDELNGLLEFPGGKIEVEESPKAAVIRETLEETGVKLDPEKVELHTIYKNKKLILYIFIYKTESEDFASWFKVREFDLFKEKIPQTNQDFLPKIMSSLISMT